MANSLDLHRAVDGLPADIFFWKAEERESWKTESHWHGSGQLFALDNGSAAVAVGGASWLLLPKRVGWIPPHERHSMISHGSVSGWSLYLPANQAASLPKRPLLFLRSGLVEQIVVRLTSLRQAKPDARALGRLLAVLADEMSVSPPESTYLPLPRDSRLVKLIRAFSQSPAAQHGLDHWAKQIGMSKRSLTRIFQEETGLSLGQWVQNFRIALATEKLAGGYDVTAAAVDCGYVSVSAFIRAFYRVTGTTPAKYRRTAMDERRVISKQISLQGDLAAERKSVAPPQLFLEAGEFRHSTRWSREFDESPRLFHS